MWKVWQRYVSARGWQLVKASVGLTLVPAAVLYSNTRWQHVLAAGSLLPGTKKNGFFERFFSGSTQTCSTYEDVAEFIKSGRVKKVVVMAGAGISTSSGIPDFRTPGTGLYYNVQKYNLPYPEAIFDIDYFSVDEKPFFALAQELYPSGRWRPNAAHYFVRLLAEKGLLHRMYTQNIDGLERLAGLSSDYLVEAHGTFATATCRVCYKSYVAEDIKEDILNGRIPRCRRKLCNGVIKPDIVFFGEQLPKRFFLFMADMPQADLLVVMGTSLEVQPFAGIADAVLPGVPRILFNREAAGPFVYSPRRNDVVVEGDMVENIYKFCDVLDWKTELEELMEKHEADYKKQISYEGKDTGPQNHPDKTGG